MGLNGRRSRALDAQVKTRKVAKEAAGKRRDKFVQLAQSRTVNAIKAIRVIGKLGNKSHYDYTEQDVKKIVAALNREIEALKVRMGEKTGHEEIGFKL